MSSVASSQQSFLANALTPQIHRPRTKFLTSAANTTISCKRSYLSDDELPKKNENNQLAKLAMVALAAGVLTFGSVPDASAAKSGGRVGGQAFRSSAPRPSAPRSSSPRINNNSRTNIYINPPAAPPLVGGYGYGYGVPFFGGWGWSPFSFFAPGPSIAVGIGGGFQLLAFFAFIGAVAAVARRITGSRNEEEDDDYY